jgi:hypothetical protein
VREFGVGFSDLRTGEGERPREKEARCVGRVGETAWMAGCEGVGFSTGERRGEEMSGGMGWGEMGGGGRAS